MDSFVNVEGLEVSASNQTIRQLLHYAHTFSPLVLVVVFAISFVAHSIVSARSITTNAPAVQTGPGGRPLPKRMRSAAILTHDTPDFSPNAKLMFKWLSVAILFTFVGDATINISHVLFGRRQHWWCGESVVVCTPP